MKLLYGLTEEQMLEVFEEVKKSKEEKPILQHKGFVKLEADYRKNMEKYLHQNKFTLAEADMIYSLMCRFYKGATILKGIFSSKVAEYFESFGFDVAKCNGLYDIKL